MNNRRSSSFKEISIVQDAKNLRDSFNRNLHFYVVKDRNIATMRDFYVALARTVWEQLCSRWIKTQEVYATEDPKVRLSLHVFIHTLILSSYLDTLSSKDAYARISIDKYSRIM